MSDKALFLGIDTSNYTTSVALCDEDGEILLNLKRLLPVGEGERGLRQSDALFAHTRALPTLMGELGELLDASYPRRAIAAVGYSRSPRDAEGSYMPCFLAGVASAASVSAATGALAFPFSHQSGHVAAALYSAGKLALLDGEERFAAFHVSGGTTDILLVTPHAGDFEIERIGGTRDINAGQAIDRTGVKMGIRFPCGREMDELCSGADIPRAKTCISVKGMECNLSGLENLAAKLYLDCEDRATVCAYCFDFIADTLLALSKELRLAYPNIPIVYAGGVMSNSRIKARLCEQDGVCFSEPQYSSDNAAGVALLAKRSYRAQKKCEA